MNSIRRRGTITPPSDFASGERALPIPEPGSRAHEQRGPDTPSNDRLAEPFERLYSALIADDPQDALHEIPSVFAEFSGAESAALLRVIGDRLMPCASLELNGSRPLPESLPLDETWAEGPFDNPGPMYCTSSTDIRIARAALTAWNASAITMLVLGDPKRLLGVILLGSSNGQVLSEEKKHQLWVMAKWAAAALQRYATHETMRAAVRSREEILAVVAHELRNPVSVIAMGAQSLVKRVADSSGRRTVDRIVRAAQRADRLIQDLLEVSAIDEGRFAIDARPLDITDVVLTGLELQQARAAAASVIIAPDISPDLPMILGDEVRLLEILENLIGNAIKFTPPGGRIEVTASSRGSEILIGVRDTGHGVSPEHLPHLFNRYWQANRTDRRGAGLGLTICKAIVEAHGGRIWAESKSEMGTSVFFTLPVAESAEGTHSPAIETANILLVDDRPENLLSLTAILERPEYRLVCAGSGAEALSLALRTRFSVILLDVAMPGMNGLEVASHLKELERSRDIPIIFITAFGNDPEEVHKAYSAGGADYLVKPLDPEIVRKKVAVFVALSRRRQSVDAHIVMGNMNSQGAKHGNNTIG